MNRTIVIIVGIVAIIALLGGVVILGRQGSRTPETSEQSVSQFVIGEKAPDFTLKDFDNKEVKLSEFYTKKAVVLDFWAAWCPFCVEEMKDLEAAHQAYKDKLVMIGVHRTDSGESITTGKKFADKQGVTYLLIQGTSEIYNASTKGVKGMPVAVFIDKNGIVKDVKIGPKTEEEIKGKIERLFVK